MKKIKISCLSIDFWQLKEKLSELEFSKLEKNKNIYSLYINLIYEENYDNIEHFFLLFSELYDYFSVEIVEI